MADEKSNAVAQSEIGPTSYVEGQGVIQHGPDDAETKAAYAAGDPKVPGTDNLRRDAADAQANADAASRGRSARSTTTATGGASGASGGDLVAPAGARKGSRRAAGGTRAAGTKGTGAARTPRAGTRKRS